MNVFVITLAVMISGRCPARVHVVDVHRTTGSWLQPLIPIRPSIISLSYHGGEEERTFHAVVHEPQQAVPGRGLVHFEQDLVPLCLGGHIQGDSSIILFTGELFPTHFILEEMLVLAGGAILTYRHRCCHYVLEFLLG